MGTPCPCSLLLAVCIQASVLGSCRLEFFESVDGQVYHSAAEEEVKRAVKGAVQAFEAGDAKKCQAVRDARFKRSPLGLDLLDPSIPSDVADLLPLQAHHSLFSDVPPL